MKTKIERDAKALLISLTHTFISWWEHFCIFTYSLTLFSMSTELFSSRGLLAALLRVGDFSFYYSGGDIWSPKPSQTWPKQHRSIMWHMSCIMASPDSTNIPLTQIIFAVQLYAVCVCVLTSYVISVFILRSHKCRTHTAFCFLHLSHLLLSLTL